MQLSSEIAKSAAVVATLGFVFLAGFQVALAAGAPWGRAAWGGAHEGRLPAGLRIASGVAALVWIAGALVVLGRVGYEVSALALSVTRWGTWVLFGLLVLGAVMNLASRSRWERFLWSPIAALLAVLCLMVALESPPDG